MAKKNIIECGAIIDSKLESIIALYSSIIIGWGLYRNAPIIVIYMSMNIRNSVACFVCYCSGRKVVISFIVVAFLYEYYFAVAFNSAFDIYVYTNVIGGSVRFTINFNQEKKLLLKLFKRWYFPFG